MTAGGTLFFALLLFARTVFDGTMLGFGHRSTILLFVQTKLAVDGRFFVKHFPDRGRLVPAMFLIGDRLEGPVESKRKGNRDGRGFLVSHAADGVITNMTGQEKFRVDKVYDTIIHMLSCPERTCQKAVSR
jgi:hypothetical protein